MLAAGCGKLFLVDVDERGLARTRDALLAKRTGLVEAIGGIDLACKRDIQKCSDIIKRSSAHVDVLVNNAGIVKGLSWHDLSYADFEHVLRVNTLAYFALAKSFLPSMVSRKQGMIVNVSSLMATMGGAETPRVLSQQIRCDGHARVS